MARKAKHDQKALPDDGWTCEMCQLGVCERCIDVMRYVVGLTDPVCRCKRKGHSGEARDKQIVDPETGTVYGPGLRVTQEGDVLNGGYDSGGGSDRGHE